MTDAAIEKDPESIPDISTLWATDVGPKKTFKSVLESEQQDAR